MCLLDNKNNDTHVIYVRRINDFPSAIIITSYYLVIFWYHYQLNFALVSLNSVQRLSTPRYVANDLHRIQFSFQLQHVVDFAVY